MKKIIYTLLTITPFMGYTQDYEPDFLDNYYIEEVVDDMAGVFHYCKARKMEYEKLMKDTKKTQFYILYLGKRDAYADILEYIESN